MSIPAKLAMHQVNLKVGPIIAKMMMVSVNVMSLRCRNRGSGDARPVDDLSGELLVYPSDLLLPGAYCALALLCSGSRADDPYLIYGNDDHLVIVVSEFCY
jgi:hypothetical protein